LGSLPRALTHPPSQLSFASRTCRLKPHYIVIRSVVPSSRGEEVCLLEQPFTKEQSLTIHQLIAQKIVKLGENISVRRFARLKIGDPTYTIASAKPAATEELAA
jgi:hypothetical protein